MKKLHVGENIWLSKMSASIYLLLKVQTYVTCIIIDDT